MADPKGKDHPIHASLHEVQKSFISGAKTVNGTFASHAGKSLKNGDGEAMAIYNQNNRVIAQLEQNLDN